MAIKLGSKNIELPYSKVYLGDILKYSSNVFNNRFISVGSASDYFAAHYSTDGINWVKMNVDIDEKGNYPQSVAYGGNILVAVGTNGQTWYCNDGENWVKGHTHIPTTTEYRSVAFGNGMFIAVPYLPDDETVFEGTIYSTNGKTWDKLSNIITSVFSLSSNAPSNIIFHNDAFWLFGREDEVYKSADGVEWEKIESSLSSSSYFTHIFIDNNYPNCVSGLHANGKIVRIDSDALTIKTTKSKWVGASYNTNKVAQIGDNYICNVSWKNSTVAYLRHRLESESEWILDSMALPTNLYTSPNNYSTANQFSAIYSKDDIIYVATPGNICRINNTADIIVPDNWVPSALSAKVNTFTVYTQDIIYIGN